MKSSHPEGCESHTQQKLTWDSAGSKPRLRCTCKFSFEKAINLQGCFNCREAASLVNTTSAISRFDTPGVFTSCWVAKYSTSHRYPMCVFTYRSREGEYHWRNMYATGKSSNFLFKDPASVPLSLSLEGCQRCATWWTLSIDTADVLWELPTMLLQELNLILHSISAHYAFMYIFSAHACACACSLDMVSVCLGNLTSGSGICLGSRRRGFLLTMVEISLLATAE